MLLYLLHPPTAPISAAHACVLPEALAASNDRIVYCAYIDEGNGERYEARGTVDAQPERHLRGALCGLSITWDPEFRTGEKGSRCLRGPAAMQHEAVAAATDADEWRWAVPRADSELQRRGNEIAVRGLAEHRAQVTRADDRIVYCAYIDEGNGERYEARGTVDAQPERHLHGVLCGLSVTWDPEFRTGEQGSRYLRGPAGMQHEAAPAAADADEWRWATPRADSELQRRGNEIAVRGLAEHRAQVTHADDRTVYCAYMDEGTGERYEARGTVDAQPERHFRGLLCGLSITWDPEFHTGEHGRRGLRRGLRGPPATSFFEEFDEDGRGADHGADEWRWATPRADSELQRRANEIAVRGLVVHHATLAERADGRAAVQMRIGHRRESAALRCKEHPRPTALREKCMISQHEVHISQH